MKNIPVIVLFLSLSIFVAAFNAYSSEYEEVSGVRRGMLKEGNYNDGLGRISVLTDEYGEVPEILLVRGIAEYGLMKYDDAYATFEKVKAKGVPARDKKFLKYILTVMEKNMSILKKIEYMDSKKPSEYKEDIAAGHLMMTDILLAQKYYYPDIVMSHIKWLKDNAVEAEELNRFFAEVYYASGLYAKALAEYKKAAEMDPGDIRLNRYIADSYVAMGDYSNAETYYNMTIEEYRKIGMKEDYSGISEIRKILNALPESYEDINKLISEGRLTEAEVLCRRRIAISGADYAAITQLGQVYWVDGKRRKAIKMFRRALRIAPDYPVAHFMLGKAYCFERKYDKGYKEFEIFKEKMDLFPSMDKNTEDYYIESLHYICYIYFITKRYDKAMSECRKIIGLDPADQRAHYNLAVCYYMYRHNRSGAYNELKRVVELDPDSDIAKTADFFIDYLRRNPDSRVIGDFTFINED